MKRVHKQQQKVEEEIRKLEAMGGTVTGKAKHFRDSAFKRFPVLFVLLSTYGLVATFYGFEKVIDGVGFFSENPRMILASGLLVLAVTGTLYRKLG